MADEIRKDPKGRKLKTGETYDEKSGRYRYSYMDLQGKRKQVYSWTLTKNDAVPIGKKQRSGESLREKEQKIEADLINHIDSSGGNMSVYDLMQRYINLQWKEVRESTRNGYRTQLKFMENNAFGKRKIKSINSTEAQEWFLELHKKHGKNYSTLHTLRGILRPAFAMAKKNRWVYDNPFDFPLAKKSYGGTKTRDALTRADMRRFLDFVRTDKHFNRYFNGIYILFNTGLRISEFCGLTIDDIDFEEHVIHVKRQLIRLHDGDKMYYYIEEPKTDNGKRDIPMFGDVEKVMKEVINNRPKLSPEPIYWNEEHTESATGFLWIDKNNKIEIAQHWQNHLRWARDKFNRIYKDELPPISPHVCRHTFCSNLASAGLSPKTLQMIMGHSSIEITLNVYTHIESGDIKKEFLNMVQNKSYDFYSLDRKPVTIAPVDDSEYVEPEYNLDEDADDDEE